MCVYFLHVIICRDVDMMVLGGDLFHENKPSRTTVVRCMRLLREYALHAGDTNAGDANNRGREGGSGANAAAVRIEVLNERAMEEEVDASAPRINFQSYGSNVRLPVFAIHGNHDDPTGAEHLSVMDVLAEANLLTYFGKHGVEAEGIGKVQVSPIVIRKGSARLALYGLGYIRDERLNRMFDAPGHVRFVKPEGVTSSVRDSSEVFNLFMIHQNKQRAIQAKNYVSPAHLPHFLDLVCWGHEHECLITPQPAIEAADAFLVSQPGSSVVTSLIEGEASRKKVMLLSVRASEYHVEEITLKNTRPFVFRQIKLSTTPGLDPDDMDLVEEFLHDNVEELIESASHQEITIDALRLPLIRLRVDYSGGFSTLNTQRFGQKYVGRVANPSDVIGFHKETRRTSAIQDDGKDPMAGVGLDDNGGALRPDAQMDHAEIDRLIRRHIRTQTKILPISDLSVAVSDYVEKQEKHAIDQCVKRTIEEAAKVFDRKPKGGRKTSGRGKGRSAADDADADDDGGDDDDEVIDDEAIARKVSEYVRTKDGVRGGDGVSDRVDGRENGVVPDSQGNEDVEEEEEEEEEENAVMPVRKAQSGRQRGKVAGKENQTSGAPAVDSRRPKRATTVASTSRQRKSAASKRKAAFSEEEDDDDDDYEDEENDDDGDDDMSYEEIEERAPSKKRSRAPSQSTAKRGRPRASTTGTMSRSRGRPSRATKPSVIENLISSDED